MQTGKRASKTISQPHCRSVKPMRIWGLSGAPHRPREVTAHRAWKALWDYALCTEIRPGDWVRKGKDKGVSRRNKCGVKEEDSGITQWDKRVCLCTENTSGNCPCLAMPFAWSSGPSGLSSSISNSFSGCTAVYEGPGQLVDRQTVWGQTTLHIFLTNRLSSWSARKRGAGWGLSCSGECWVFLPVLTCHHSL